MINNIMKTFSEWRKKILEMAGTGSIVSKKDCKNPDFQIFGSFCNKKVKKSKK